MFYFVVGFGLCAGLVAIHCWAQYEYDMENARKMYVFEHGHRPDW